MAKDYNTGIYSEVKLSIFAEGASTSGNNSSGKGLYIPDDTWKSSANRKKGAVSGMAKSEEFNTPVRQATSMSVLLANLLAMRNDRNVKAYSGDFGTVENGSDENALLKKLGQMTKIFDKDHFLFDNEVLNKHLGDKVVSNRNIGDNAVTYRCVGDLLGTSRVSYTSNGITVALYQGDENYSFQNGRGGNLKISVSSTAVNNSRFVNHKGNLTTTNKLYLWASSETNTYVAPVSNYNVYITDGRLNSVGLTSFSNVRVNSYIHATNYISTEQYFNVTSDKRLKHNFSEVPLGDVFKFVEETPIRMFNYKNSEERFIGIVAQDVENKNIEEFNVTVKNDEGYLTIKEDKLVYILWEYVKYLKSEIEYLKRR